MQLYREADGYLTGVRKYPGPRDTTILCMHTNIQIVDTKTEC